MEIEMHNIEAAVVLSFSIMHYMVPPLYISQAFVVGHMFLREQELQAIF